jgi:hypothetical protein
MARGMNSFWHTLRTVSTKARCSSEMVKSMRVSQWVMGLVHEAKTRVRQ